MKPSATSRPDPLLLLLFLIPVMGIIVAGSRSYIRERRAVETEAWHQLSVIADMKVGQLSALRTEWMRDAEMVVANSRLMPSLRETLAAPPGAEATGRVRRWMEAYLQQGYTHVALVDAQGQVRLGVGEDTARESRDRALALNALRAGQHVLVDFHRDDPPRDIHLALGVPLPAEGLGPPIGALVLKIEPAKSLYPLLQTWPTPSASGETLLVRREKDEIVYLTPLRHAQDAAMNLRRPVSQRALTAAQAVLGREGAVEGQDYRGVRVLAATRRVPDTPWYLIAKIDASEAYRPLHREMILLILIAGSLIVATGAGVALLWRHQRSRFYQQRYEAEIERRALMGHYDYLSRYANDIILLTDETGRIVEANDRATVTYGCAREELLQLNIRDLRDPATLADFDAQWRAIAESDGHVFETRHQRRDGTSVPVEVSVRAIDVDGVRFTQSIIRDITERKAMEESLRQAHQELAAIIETAPAGILVLDRDGKVRLWNKAAERMSGWTSEEVLGQPASDWKDLAATGPAISRRETTLRRKDGSAIEMIVTSAPLFDADGATMGTMAVASDITERKTAERSLRESEGRFRQVVENAPAGIYIQTGGRFRYLNHVAIEAFGATSADQLLDRPIPELIHPDFRDRVEDRVKILVDDKKPVPQLEEKYLKLDGTSFDVEVSAVPFVYGNVNGSLVFFRDITEHKQAQAALRESEWRVQTTVQASGIGLWDWCIRYDYVYYSPEWKAQLGYADEEIGATQAEWEERLHPEDRERTMAQLREYIADPSESFEAEFRMRHKDGTYRWILARGALVRDEDGSPRRVLGSSVDLTERKQVEEELRQHRLLVQSILDATPDLIYIYDLEERRNVFANRQVAEFLGFTGDEIESLGEDLMPELLHPEDASRVADHHARCAAAADGEVIELEYRMRHADGRWRWLHSRDVVFFRDTDGMARQILGLAQDVTERRLAEDALRTNEARLGRAQRIAALGDWEILWRRPEDGAADEVHSWSAEVYRIFGVSRESFTPSLEAFFSSVHPDDREAERAAIRTCRETGQPYRSEYRIVRPDGTVRHVREQGELERDAAGAVRMIGTVQDITEHKHLQDQLLQAQRLESVGRLAGGVAHDFNNLLMVIIGYTELMLVAPELNAGIEEPLNEIRKAAERAAELTQQLLAFSRKQVAQPRVIDLNALIRDTENMLRRLIGEDVLLVTQLRPDLASVKADPGQINQVLMNLAVNARDAMPNGGKLVLETRHVEFSEADAKRHPYVPTGRYVSLVVSDTGSGVDEHARSHLFEPFFTTKDRTKGTGLGLSTVYGIVKQAGGHIWVYSEVGRGTAFHICLPRVEDKPAAEAPKVRPTNVRGSETILVVEDQAEVRRLAREVLEGFGYTVLDAASAAEALDVSEAHPSPIHLVLSDVVMPEMTGRDLVDRLKPLRPETKVLFMSGYTDNVILHQGALPTGVAYLQKPFTPEALALKVREVLG